MHSTNHNPELIGFACFSRADAIYTGDWARRLGRAFGTDAEKDTFLGQWGNLTPLDKSANSSKSTRSWEEAKESYFKDSIYETTRRLREEYGPEWNAATICERTEQLAQWAVGRWPSGDDIVSA
jgi:hypothetical protein